MHLKPRIHPDSVITMADGSRKSITEIKIGDEVQTYDMNSEEFDAANIAHNEQTTTKIDNIYSVEVQTNEIYELELSGERVLNEDPIAYDDKNEPDGEPDEHDVWTEVGDGKTVLLHYSTAVMGGSGLGWQLADNDKMIKQAISILQESEDDMRMKFNQIEDGVEIQLDEGDKLLARVVKSCKQLSGDDTVVFHAIRLEAGDSVFVDDVMVGAARI